MSRKDAHAEIVKKALTDPAFKAELLKNPAAAIEKAAGVKIPAGVTVKVVEDGPSVVHLVLPAQTKPASLSDGQLAGIAGGGATMDYCHLSTNKVSC